MAKLNSERIGRASAKAGVWNLLKKPLTRGALEKAFVKQYPNLRHRFDSALRSLRACGQIGTNHEGLIEKRKPMGET